MRSSLRKTDLAVDLGTSKIAVFVRGEGLVLEEPACIAFRGQRNDPNAVIATGHAAARMCGKTPEGIVVVKPIQDGVIRDAGAAGLLLRLLLAKHGIGARGAQRRFLVGTLYGASSMERRAFEQVAILAGAKHVVLVPEPMAAAIGAGLRIDEPQASMVVDIGGGATEAIVVSLKSVVSGGSIRIGGDAMNGAISQFLRRHAGLEVGLQEARRLREAVSGPADARSCIEARGIDSRLRRPRSAVVQVSDLQMAASLPLAAITAMVKRVVDNLPVELAADLIDLGITLTGGGAATAALQARIEEVTHVPVRLLAAPQQAVINGCGRILDYFDHIA